MVLNDWLNDMPQQFLDKKNIEILVRAFANQMEELNIVFDELKSVTTLDNATGRNLDYVGDVLSISRKQAQNILLSATNEEITDETYRNVLKYKALQNNCDCTYEDIMQSISLLWDTSNLKYIEDPERPATIYVALPDVSVDGIDPTIGRVLAIKPAGVSMIYTVGYATKVNISGIEKVRVPRIILTFTGSERRWWYLDGTVALDGSKTLYSEKIGKEIESLDVEPVIYRNKVQNPDLMINTSLITYKKYWELDGSHFLDGSKELSAEIIKEVL